MHVVAIATTPRVLQAKLVQSFRSVSGSASGSGLPALESSGTEGVYGHPREGWPIRVSAQAAWAWRRNEPTPPTTPMRKHLHNIPIPASTPIPGPHCCCCWRYNTAKPASNFAAAVPKLASTPFTLGSHSSRGVVELGLEVAERGGSW